MLSARVNPLGYQSMSVVGGINKDCETELEEMNGHVCEQHQISDDHIQLSARLRVKMPTGVLPDEVCGNCPAAVNPWPQSQGTPSSEDYAYYVVATTSDPS